MNALIPCSESCALCHNPSFGTRYGAHACVACHAFFRRAVVAKEVLKCQKTIKCRIGYGTEGKCKKCRFLKCLKNGMRPEYVRFRDKLGPRNHRFKNFSKATFNFHADFKNFFRIQRKQRLQHEKYGRYNTLIETMDSVRINQKLYRRAQPSDINLTLNLGFQNAMEWMKQLEVLTKRRFKKRILSEYGIGFILIDQAFKSSVETECNSYWLLQNDTFLSNDFFLKASFSSELMKIGVVNKQASLHFEFV